MRGVLVEHGNGFPRPGAYVLGIDGWLYRVLSTTDHILTDEPGSGRGSRMHCEVERVDWSDCPEGDEHSARVELPGQRAGIDTTNWTR